MVFLKRIKIPLIFVFFLSISFLIFFFWQMDFFQKTIFQSKKELQQDNNLLNSTSVGREELRKKIGQMIIIGFRGVEINQNSKIVKIIRDLNIGGVALFDYDIPSHSFPRNILNPRQTKELIKNLQKYASEPLFIGVDVEGGKVNRLKPKYGSLKILSAKKLGEIDKKEVSKKEAEKVAEELNSLGFNMDFAPVVDLDINPANPIIGKLGRAFSSDPQKVVFLSQILIKHLRNHNVIPVAKHFPGHGSSSKDSHLGIADVTNSYQPKELFPYKELEKEKMLDAVMVGHIFNQKIDKKYPASLSKNFLGKILRKKIGFKGVIISDDMEMGAITKYYGLKEAVIKSINAGCDILVFSNNSDLGYDGDLAYKVHQIIFEAVENGEIPMKRIIESSNRIELLKRKFKILSVILTRIFARV